MNEIRYPSWKEFRNLVSIIEVAESIGYRPHRKSSTGRPALKNADGDIIVIKNPTNLSEQSFVNALTGRDGGDVIQFVRDRLDKFPGLGPFMNEIDGINKVLSYYSNLDTNYCTIVDKYNFKEGKPFDIKSVEFSDSTVSTLHYLERERKVSPDTLKKFTPFIKMVASGSFRNIGFPYTIPGSDVIRGFEIRNSGFKSFSTGGDKVNASWQAFLGENKALVSNVFIFESAIDALSFYELNKHTHDWNKSLLVSTGGNPSLNQQLNLIKEYPRANFYGCFDNDIHGHLDDITLNCIKENVTLRKDKQPDGSVKFKVNDKTFSLQERDVNLKNFATKGDVSISIRSLKPKSGKDWNEIICNLKKNEISVKKKPVFKR